MPRATVVVDETETVNLKTCPDGFVKLRRLTYGQLLHRRAMAASMRVSSGKGRNFEGEMKMVNEAVTRYEFANCIVDHNLEDEDGKKLNFSNAADLTNLDPRIGEEIDRNISRMNNFEDDEDEGNS